nr:MAG TPA: hypothetical protein [Caudoviricetes sp.]DAQ99339.1 MAG TPA: hypothetical protein [Caudoviricetes sp.]
MHVSRDSINTQSIPVRIIPNLIHHNLLIRTTTSVWFFV